MSSSNLPFRDYFTGEKISYYQNLSYKLASEQIKVSKRLARQQQISNFELKELNETNNQLLQHNEIQTALQAKIGIEITKQTGLQQSILSETQRQSKIQSELLYEAKNQTNIQTGIWEEAKSQTIIGNHSLELLKLQTQSVIINDLEKKKQKQIKQVAFSISHEVKKIIKYKTTIKKYISLIDLQRQIKIVNLNQNDPDEIADKIFIRDLFQSINDLLDKCKSQLTQLEIEDVDNFYTSSDLLLTLMECKEELGKKITSLPDLEPVKLDNPIENIYIKSLYKTILPNFYENNAGNILFQIIYLILSISTGGILLIVVFSIILFIEKYNPKKKITSEHAPIDEKKELTKVYQMLLDDIEKLELIISTFEIKYLSD